MQTLAKKEITAPIVTAKNLTTFPPSQMLRLITGDIDKLMAEGIELNMSEWLDVDRGSICTVCLGGVFLASLMDRTKPWENLSMNDIIKKVAPSDQEFNSVGLLMQGLDALRCGYYPAAIRSICTIWNIDAAMASILQSEAIETIQPASFYGRLTTEEIEELKHKTLQIADLLEAHNF